MKAGMTKEFTPQKTFKKTHKTVGVWSLFSPSAVKIFLTRFISQLYLVFIISEVMQWKEDSKHKYWVKLPIQLYCAIVHVFSSFRSFSLMKFLRGFLAQFRNPHLSFPLTALWQFVIYWVAGYMQKDIIPEHTTLQHSLLIPVICTLLTTQLTYSCIKDFFFFF